MRFSRSDVWVSDCERFVIKLWRKNYYEVSAIITGKHEQDADGVLSRGDVAWVTHGVCDSLEEAKEWCRELGKADASK